MALLSVEQFCEKYEGESVDYDHVYNAQCVDLFNFYVSEVLGGPWIGTPATGGARDLYEVDSAARGSSFKKMDANDELQAGDVLVYGEPYGRYINNGGTRYFGHVAIYVGNDTVLQQNARISFRTTLDKLSKKYMLGFLRPLRFIGENSPQNVPTTAQIKNKHTIQKGDTFWGLEEERGLTHGTLQQLNPGLDPKALRIGSQIIVAPEPDSELNTDTVYYEIRDGDTFWKLEDALQLAHGTLQELNPDIEPRKLQIGGRLRVK